MAINTRQKLYSTCPSIFCPLRRWRRKKNVL